MRHSSITYKLKLNGGDMKAVQGDSGESFCQGDFSYIIKNVYRRDRLIHVFYFARANYINNKKNSLQFIYVPYTQIRPKGSKA